MKITNPINNFNELVNKACEMVNDIIIFNRNDINFKAYDIGTHRVGYCKRIRTLKKDLFHVVINTLFLITEEEIINTLIHEILHTINFDCGHKFQWLYLANKINIKFGLKIQRCSNHSTETINNILINERNKKALILKCKCCKKEFIRKRAIDRVKFNLDRYQCGHCRGRLEIVKEV